MVGPLLTDAKADAQLRSVFKLGATVLQTQPMKPKPSQSTAPALSRKNKVLSQPYLEFLADEHFLNLASALMSHPQILALLDVGISFVWCCAFRLVQLLS
jgi:hypothetical protein